MHNTPAGGGMITSSSLPVYLSVVEQQVTELLHHLQLDAPPAGSSSTGRSSTSPGMGGKTPQMVIYRPS